MDERRKPKLTMPEAPVSTWTRGQKATWWRQYVMKITREELSALSHYAPDTIWLLENTTKPSAAWERYKLNCELMHRRKFPTDTATFNWGIPK